MPQTVLKSTDKVGSSTPQDNASQEARGASPSPAEFIAKLSPDMARLNPSSRHDALVRLAGYSVVDFLQVAGDLKLSPQAAASVLMDSSVQQKNQSFFEALRGEAARLCFDNAPSESEKKILLEMAAKGERQSDRMTEKFFEPHLDPECGKVLSALDAFYAPLVGMRQVALEEPRNPLQEEAFEWLIEKYERAFEKHQWINVWREKIEAAFGGVGKTFEALSEAEQKVFFLKETISEEMLRSIATRAGIDMEAPEQQRLLKEHKYTALGVVTNLQKDEVFEHLSEELANCLRARGVPAGTVRLEQEHGAFVLKENEPDLVARERERTTVTVLDRSSTPKADRKHVWAVVCQDSLAYCKRDTGEKTTVRLGPQHEYTFDYVVHDTVYSIGGKAYAIGKTNTENGASYSLVSTEGVTPVNVRGAVVSLLDAPGGPIALLYRDDGSSVLWRDGQVLCEEKGQINELSIIGGQLTYIVEADRQSRSHGEGNYQVVHGAWRSPKLEFVWGMREVGEKLAFAARTMSHGEVLYFDRVPSAPHRTVQRDILDVGGKPAYVTTDHAGATLVYHGNDCIATMPQTHRVDLYPVGNDVAISAWLKGQTHEDTQQVVFRGKTHLFVSQGESSIYGGLEVNRIKGDLLLAYEGALSPSDKGVGPNHVIVTHGERRWEHEAKVVRLVEAGDKVAYVLSDKNSARFVCEGTISEPYARIISPAENVGGVPAFYAIKLNGQHIVRHGEREFDVSDRPMLIGNPHGELTYLLQEGADVNLYVNGNIAESFKDRVLYRVRSAYNNEPGTFILELRDNEAQTEEFVAIKLPQTKTPGLGETLPGEERELLRKMNLVAAPTAETVRQYQEERRARELEKNAEPTFAEMMNSFVSKSKGAIGTINAMIHDSPELFLDVFRAKTTPQSSAHLNAVLRRIAPVTVAAHERQERAKSNSGLSAPSLGSLSGDSARQEISMVGGDPKVKSVRNLITSSLKTPHFVTQHMLAGYGSDGWHMLKLPVGAAHSLDTRVVTCVAHIEPKAASTSGILGSALSWIKEKSREFRGEKVERRVVGEIELPRLLNSEYVESRIHVRDGSGKETPAQTSRGADGAAHVSPPQGARDVAYSFAVPTEEALKEAIQPVSQSAYESFITRDCREVSSQIAQPFGGLSESSRMFLEEIQHEPPLVRIGKIKDFISERGHYDMDNDEVRHAAEKRSPTENIGMMEARALELKLDGRAAKDKEFAGVCSDYAMLCAAMLRESGIPAGVLTGINIDATGGGKESATHAKVFVPWPVAGEQGDYVFLEIEATPAGGHREHRTPTQIDAKLSEREAAIAEPVQREDVKPIESAEAQKVEALSADEIRKMVNGTLEHTVNKLLAKMTPQNTANVEELLGLALYSGVKPSDDGFVASARALGVRHNAPNFNPELPRQDFFETLTTYVDAQTRHIQKDTNEPPPDARRAAIHRLEHIVERGQCALSQREFATAIAALAYLRSEKMLRS